MKSNQTDVQVTYSGSLTRKVLRAIKQDLKGFSAWREKTAGPSGVNAFSSGLLIWSVIRLREILLPKILMGWRSSTLRNLLVSSGRDFTARPLAISGLFLSSSLLFYSLLSPYSDWTLGNIAVMGFLILLSLSGLLAKVDLKSLLGSSLIFRVWVKTFRFSDALSTKPLQPGPLKPSLPRRKDMK